MEEVRFINLTPHTITLVKESGNEEIPSSGLARCSQVVKVIDTLNGVNITETRFGEVSGLPEPEEGTFFIVSALVAQAMKGVRKDLLIVSETVCDESGRIIGCKSFGRI